MSVASVGGVGVGEFDMDSLLDEMLANGSMGIGEDAPSREDLDDAVPHGWRSVGDGDGGKPDVIVIEPDDRIVVAPVVPVAPAVPVEVIDPAAAAFSAGVNVTVRQVTTGGAKTDLTAACDQWARRPADQRFWTVGEMAAKCAEWKNASREDIVDLGRVTVVNDSGRMILSGGGLKGPGEFTHYSFGQLCQTAGAPAGYLRELGGDLAAQCLTSGLRRKDREVLGSAGNVLVRSEGEGRQQIGAFLSRGYSRIWNSDIVGRLQEFESRGWRVPPARPADIDDPRARRATEADVLLNNKGGGGISVKVGDLIAPAGLYASDRDCFAFMVLEGGTEIGGSVMNRGFFVSNSEVGDMAFSLTTFLYDAVCGNHIVWGASEVTEVRLVHRGRANTRWIGDLQRALQRYAANGTDKERAVIMSAIGMKIADGRDAVVDKLFKNKSLGLTKTAIESAWDWSVKEARLRGNKFIPESVWGMVCGLTRVSQECGWANERVAIDKAAGKLLGMAG